MEAGSGQLEEGIGDVGDSLEIHLRDRKRGYEGGSRPRGRSQED